MPKRTRSEFEEEEETVSACISPAGGQLILSHAAKRAARKRQKKGHAADAAAEDPSKPASEMSKPARGLSVWVGNLNWKTRPEALKAFFADVGEPTRVHLPAKALHGNAASKSFVNRGFAFVDFRTEAEKTAAVSKSEQHLDGRKLLVKDGSDFTGRPGTEGQESTQTPKAPLTGLTKTAKKILSIQKHPECASLFIGNLGFAATEDSLTSLIARYMKPIHGSKDLLEKDKWLRKVRMGTFEDSGKCKGWAFVDFTTPEYATLALTNPRNHSLDGRALVVEYASPDSVRRSGLGHSRDPNEEPSTKGPPNHASRRPQKAERIAAKSANRGTEVAAATDEDDQSPGGPEARREEHATPSTSVSRRKLHQSPRSIGKAKRAKPGAALASAPRESGAIVASTGKKIIF